MVEGTFDPDLIRIEEVQGALRRTPMSEAWKEGVWTTYTKKLGFKPWPNDKKPSRWHFVNALANGKELVIQADPSTSYFDCLGSRFPEFEERFGKSFVAVNLSVGISVVAKNRHGENCMLVCLRSEKNDYKRGGLTIGAAGAISMKNKETPKDAALRELKEEAGIEAHEIKNLECLGVAREVNLPDGGPEFFAFTDVSVEELHLRKHDEENETLFVPLKLLTDWVCNFSYAICECSIAGFLMVGQKFAGSLWRMPIEHMLRLRREFAQDEKTYHEFEAADKVRLAKAFRELKERSK